MFSTAGKTKLNFVPENKEADYPGLRPNWVKAAMFVLTLLWGYLANTLRRNDVLNADSWWGIGLAAVFGFMAVTIYRLVSKEDSKQVSLFMFVLGAIFASILFMFGMIFGDDVINAAAAGGLMFAALVIIAWCNIMTSWWPNKRKTRNRGEGM